MHIRKDILTLWRNLDAMLQFSQKQLARNQQSKRWWEISWVLVLDFLRLKEELNITGYSYHSTTFIFAHNRSNNQW